MNTDYAYPKLVEGFMALPINKALSITLDALAYEKDNVSQSKDPRFMMEYVAQVDTLEASNENAWTHYDLLEIISIYEDDPSINLHNINFQEENEQ
jgi:hypothetical protein